MVFWCFLGVSTRLMFGVTLEPFSWCLENKFKKKNTLSSSSFWPPFKRSQSRFRFVTLFRRMVSLENKFSLQLQFLLGWVQRVWPRQNLWCDEWLNSWSLPNSVNFYGRNVLKPDNCCLLSIDPWISTDSNHRVCSKPNPSGWQNFKILHPLFWRERLPVIVGSFLLPKKWPKTIKNQILRNEKSSKVSSLHPTSLTVETSRQSLSGINLSHLRVTSHESCGKTLS